MPHHLWCCLHQPQYSPLEISHYSLLSGSIHNIQLLLLIVKISEEFYFVLTKCVFLTWLWSTGRDCLGTPAGRAPGRWWSQTTRHHLSPSETCRLWQGEYDQTQVFEGEKKIEKPGTHLWGWLHGWIIGNSIYVNNNTFPPLSSPK